MTQNEKSSLCGWALVELFGHQKIIGVISEHTVGSAAFLRVDVPEGDGQPAFTRFYGTGAIYSINPVSEAIGRRMVEEYRAVPVTRYELNLLADKIAANAASPSVDVPENDQEEDGQPVF